MSGIVINIGRDFSRYPAGRFPSDGKYNGETFRKKFLVDPLRSGENVEIHLDDAVDFGSSFLEEAFGGLIRSERFTQNRLHELISFVTDKHFIVPDEIWSYIDDAESVQS